MTFSWVLGLQAHAAISNYVDFFKIEEHTTRLTQDVQERSPHPPPRGLKAAHTWRAKPVVLLHSSDILYMLVKTVCGGVRSNPSSAITIGPWAVQLLLAPVSSSIRCVSRVPGTSLSFSKSRLEGRDCQDPLLWNSDSSVRWYRQTW